VGVAFKAVLFRNRHAGMKEDVGPAPAVTRGRLSRNRPLERLR
jgi:hypothetical protein